MQASWEKIRLCQIRKSKTNCRIVMSYNFVSACDRKKIHMVSQKEKQTKNEI